MSFLRKIILPYLFLFSIFCIDIWVYFGLGEQVSFLTFSFLIAILFSRPLSFPFILTALILLMSISSTMGHPLWLPLIYSLPSIGIIAVIKPQLYFHKAHPPLAASLAVGAYLLLFRPYFLGLSPFRFYTIGAIFGTIIVSTIFSLTLKTGKKGQSLTQSAV